jgi:hypothetical protein
VPHRVGPTSEYALDGNMNPADNRDPKGTITKKTIAPSLLALACLTAIASTARAGYRDGMNLYQYVESNTIRYVDPAGRQKVGFDLKVDVTHTTWDDIDMELKYEVFSNE